jgi:uncharacterized membrane protein YfcA
MSFVVLALFLAITALGAYFQTVTGFGLAMIIMGLASALELVPLATLAAVISLLSVANGLVALPGRLHHIDWPAVRAALLGICPAIVVGVLLLEYLSKSASDLLLLLLGLVILQGGLSFARRPAQLSERSSDRGFLFAGVLSGLSDGLFGIAGPPLIYQLYRQPLALVTVRNVLLLLFALTSASRSLFVGLRGGLDAEVWILTGTALPAVALAAFVGRHWPPPISAIAMRRIVFTILILIGLSLVVSSAQSWIAAARS